MTDAPTRPVELAAALEAATAGVRGGPLPCAVFGVSDARATLGVRSVSRDGERSVRPDDLFFLASVTKPIVAAAVMQLVDEGRLDLRAPVQDYVPAFRGPGKERVTAWHVLTHTSGLSDLPVEVLRRERPGYDRLVRKVCAEELAFEPGTRYAYASDPFYLLAEIIAHLTGMPFPVALERRLLAPLGMRDTTFDPRTRRGRIVAVEGVRMGNPIVRELILRFLARATLPGGGLFGTAEDVLRFGRAILRGMPGAGAAGAGEPVAGEGIVTAGEGEPGRAVLSRAAIAEMTREQTAGIPRLDAEGSVVGEGRYGLGWRMAPRDAPGSPRAVTHGGVSGTRLWIDPDAGLVFVFLTNLWDAPDEPAWEVLREVYAAWA